MADGLAAKKAAGTANYEGAALKNQQVAPKLLSSAEEAVFAFRAAANGAKPEEIRKHLRHLKAVALWNSRDARRQEREWDDECARADAAAEREAGI